MTCTSESGTLVYYIDVHSVLFIYICTRRGDDCWFTGLILLFMSQKEEEQCLFSTVGHCLTIATSANNLINLNNGNNTHNIALHSSHSRVHSHFSEVFDICSSFCCSLRLIKHCWWHGVLCVCVCGVFGRYLLIIFFLHRWIASNISATQKTKNPHHFRNEQKKIPFEWKTKWNEYNANGMYSS